ncbi:Glu/Leu/Phe/Val family dehydrogenase [Nocardioides taihuensis]|uniref:Glutamate dehydrogenase n=1 Tax=Nocardioides taihuensis TaxID=1835606 RepID=A0ABW0BDP1_9ACTN
MTVGAFNEQVAGAEATAFWPVDDLGPEKVVFLRLPLGCTATVVVDNTALGVGIGGTRMTTTVDAAEVARLARAMTIKNAAAALPHGGAKSGITIPRPLDVAERERVVRAFAVAIRGLTDYVPGPDMGTCETDMAWVRDEIGRAIGLPAVLGGIPLDELGATGYGLAVTAEALEEAGLLEVRGARVIVQGFGAVGKHAALQLAERGALVVGVSDVRGAIYQPDGLDLEALAAFKGEQGVHEFPFGTEVPRDDLLTMECDIFVPAAQADVITKQNVDTLHTRFVLQGANLPITPEAEHELHQRGVLCIPDVIANAGGVICGAVEYAGGNRDQASLAISTKVRRNVLQVLERMKADGLEPRAAALRMAHERIAAAEGYRRRF